MDSSTAKSLLRFLRWPEQLKDTLRSAHTSEGRRESVAAHILLGCHEVAKHRRRAGQNGPAQRRVGLLQALEKTPVYCR